MAAAAAAVAGATAAPVMSSMELVLTWIGFDATSKRETVLEELGDDLSDFFQTTSKELDGLVKTLQALPARERVSIGFQRLKKLKAVIHWAKDRQRIGMPASVEIGTSEVIAKAIFLTELAASTERQIIREQSRDSLAARSKDASPGKLKDEGKWEQWEGSLTVMLGILQGVNGVPLSYVIRETEHEDGDVYDNFIDECISRARLDGPQFAADARLVHELLQSLTIGENAEHWLKEIKKKHDGRQDMTALRSHYRGAGNQSRRINAAKKLHETLHYKNERALKFSQFVSQAKNMFNIFEECKEPQPETVKLRFLWDNCEAPYLQTTMQVMKAQLGQDDTCWTFVAACDHLASQIPVDGGSRVKFAASAIGSTPGATNSNIMKDGKVRTSTYSNEEWWNVLTQEERDEVTKVRGKSGGGGGSKGKKNSKSSSQSRKIKALQKSLKKKSRKISSMQRSTKETSDASNSDSDTSDDNAGSAFGGRAEKQRAKKKKRKN